jgi:hypothetical protein
LQKRTFSDWIVNEWSSEGQKSTQGLVEKPRTNGLIDLSRRIIERRSRALEHHHLGNVAAVMLLLQLLLARSERMVQVDDYKLRAALVHFVLVHRAPRLLELTPPSP